MSTVSFQNALQRLVEDKAYRKAVSTDGSLLQKDFNLGDPEMQVMKSVGIQTGWIKGGGEKGIHEMGISNCCCCCCPA